MPAAGGPRRLAAGMVGSVPAARKTFSLNLLQSVGGSASSMAHILTSLVSVGARDVWPLQA
jgi:hypothetical protein